MLKPKLLLPAVLLALAGNSFAASLGPYGGIQYSSVEDDENTELGLLSARLGTFLTDNLSAEVRIGTGVKDHSEYDSTLATKFTVEADQLIGAYLRGGVFVSPSVYPYVIVGYSQLDYTVSIDGLGSMSDDESGTSLGLGIEFFVGKNLGLTLEAMRLLDEEDIELDAITLGLSARF